MKDEMTPGERFEEYVHLEVTHELTRDEVISIFDEAGGDWDLALLAVARKANPTPRLNAFQTRKAKR